MNDARSQPQIRLLADLVAKTLEPQAAKTNVPPVRGSRRASGPRREAGHTHGGFQRRRVQPGAWPAGRRLPRPHLRLGLLIPGRPAIYCNTFCPFPGAAPMSPGTGTEQEPGGLQGTGVTGPAAREKTVAGATREQPRHPRQGNHITDVRPHTRPTIPQGDEMDSMASGTSEQ